MEHLAWHREQGKSSEDNTVLSPQDWQEQTAALVIAHPGHELRVYRWLELVRPYVFVFTDGSGRSQVSRLASTTRILQHVQATPAEVYGPLTDRQAYKILLHRDIALCLALVEQLASAFNAHRVRYVVGDAMEGYNPVHDLCRLVINAAIVRSYQQYALQIANFDFSLVALPSSCPESIKEQAIWISLDRWALDRKHAAAVAYRELQYEVQQAFESMGLEAFAVECLRPVRQPQEAQARWLAETPAYESYGGQRVAAGYYQQVIRYREHLYPIAEALWDALS